VKARQKRHHLEAMEEGVEREHHLKPSELLLRQVVAENVPIIRKPDGARPQQQKQGEQKVADPPLRARRQARGERLVMLIEHETQLKYEPNPLDATQFSPFLPLSTLVSDASHVPTLGGEKHLRANGPISRAPVPCLHGLSQSIVCLYRAFVRAASARADTTLCAPNT
jgi:hypothetical protein